jgi:hypothetical protein
MGTHIFPGCCHTFGIGLRPLTAATVAMWDQHLAFARAGVRTLAVMIEHRIDWRTFHGPASISAEKFEA